ncbi:MAG: LLM class flavin-dependent oxidoreductase [Haloarculaceae archaeon]
MRYGTGVFPRSVAFAVEFARTVESLGYEKLWITDSHQLYADPYVTLTACAAATDDVALSPGVTNATTRHETVTADAIASVDEVSDGRASLAIGAGDSAVYSIGKTPVSVAELRETTDTIQRLLDGETVDYDGVPFALDLDHGDVPVHVAAEGPKTLRMAGEVADGVVFGGGTAPEVVENGLDHVARGAERAGRSLDDVHVTVLAPACVAESRAAGVGALLDVLEPIAYHNFSFSVEDAPADLREELRGLVERHDMREHGQAEADPARAVSPEVRDYLGDRFAIAGPAEACRERVDQLAARGVDELFLGFPATDPLDHARAFAAQVVD